MNSTHPWQDEPDRKEWVDKPTGLKCLIRRISGLGHLCGYVGIGPKHRLHGTHYDYVNIDVHGGLTYAGNGVVDAGEDRDLWWFGFDCAHAGDVSPGLGTPFTDGVYRDIEFVTSECETLARELQEVGNE